MVLMMPCIYSGQAGDGAQRLHASGWDPYETNEPMPVQPFSSVRSRSVLSYAPSVRLSICSVSSTGPPPSVCAAASCSLDFEGCAHEYMPVHC